MSILNRDGGRILESKKQFPEESVAIKNLRHGYFVSEKKSEKKLEVLKGIDLTIRNGQIVALVGPSGAGKSTLLHILGLMEKPLEGTLNILGWDSQKISETDRDLLRSRYIGFMFQFHYLLPELTLLENIMLPQRILGLKKLQASDRAMDLLQSVGLGERGHHYPSEVSGGEQQRASLCRAMANRPALLICDEPTGNLDVETGESIRDLIWRMSRVHNTTAIIATHNLELAKAADRIVKIIDGKIVSGAA